MKLVPCLTAAAVAVLSTSAAAQAPCPAAKDLPQLTIDKVREPAVPVIDEWQIFWDQVPISDAQLASLAHDDVLIERMRGEMKQRGSRVYIGMGIAALGAAVSSVGWVLYGQNELDSSITLGLAAGGLLLGVGGTLYTTTWIQQPLEPFVAPTPEHRLTRQQARTLVAQVNRQLYQQICRAAGQAKGERVPAASAAPQRPTSGSPPADASAASDAAPAASDAAPAASDAR